MNVATTPSNYTARDAKNAGNTAMHNAVDWIYGKIIERIQIEAPKGDNVMIDFGTMIKAYEEPCPYGRVLNTIMDNLRDAGFSVQQGSSNLGGSEHIEISWADVDTDSEFEHRCLQKLFGQ
ncbi:hypothetical protein [Serratia phage SP1]|nr:hypothetical protein [Serratia phage SP1]